MLEQMNAVFLEEATELLDNLEGQLLALEEDPQNAETIGAVFRAMHTIKGSAAMFGFDAVSHFTHEIESTFDLVRNGIVPVTHELINFTLSARDHIRDLLAANPVPPELQTVSDKIVSDFQRYVQPYKNDGNPEKSSEPKSTESQPLEQAGAGWSLHAARTEHALYGSRLPDILSR